MRQMVISRHGAPDVCEPREAPTPAPRPGEVRIAARASGVNFGDIRGGLGLYPDAPRLPLVVGYEVAGVVDAAAPAVHRVHEGDRVVALTQFGGYATHVVVPADLTFELPG